MDLSYFTNTPDEEKIFTLDINDVITRDGGINGAQVGQEITLINRHLPETKRIDILINSEGGSITEGIKIASAIVSSKITIKTINMGFAASMAGVLAVLGKERRGVDFGLTMLHNPRAKGLDLNDTTDPQDRDALIKMKDQLMTLIINRTGIDKDSLSAIMDRGSFMNFDETKKLNFVDDEPLTFGKRPETVPLGMAIYENIKKINEFHCSLEQADITNIHKKENHMEDATLKQFEARIEEKDLKIQEFKNTIAEKASEIDTLKSDFQNVVKEKETLATEIKAQATIIQGYKDDEAVLLVENAIKDGKFPEDQKEALTVQAKANFESFKTIVNAMVKVEKLEGKSKTKISELLELAMAQAGVVEGQDLGGLTRFQWLQKNDSKKLKEIKATQPDLYKALTDEFKNHVNSK